MNLAVHSCHQGQKGLQRPSPPSSPVNLDLLDDPGNRRKVHNVENTARLNIPQNLLPLAGKPMTRSFHLDITPVRSKWLVTIQMDFLGTPRVDKKKAKRGSRVTS